jgi:hypothetical protein
MPEKELTRNNIILMACLLTYIVFFPVIVGHMKIISNVISSAIIVSTIFALDFPRRTRGALTGIGSVTLVLIWVGDFFDLDMLRLASYFIIFFYMGFITVTMIIHIARSKKVTPTLILSAVNGYLLLGYLGSFLLATAAIIQTHVLKASTHAFQFPGGPPSGLHDYLYFSFVTLTTLGYGDVTPVSPIAKSFTLIIAVSGQLYVAILIAMLVGKFLSRQR